MSINFYNLSLEITMSTSLYYTVHRLRHMTEYEKAACKKIAEYHDADRLENCMRGSVFSI